MPSGPWGCPSPLNLCAVRVLEGDKKKGLRAGGGTVLRVRPLLLLAPLGGEAWKISLLSLTKRCLSLSEPTVNLEQCEQLVAELRGNVHQAVQLYHLVSVGHQLEGEEDRTCQCLTAECLEQ